MKRMWRLLRRIQPKSRDTSTTTTTSWSSTSSPSSNRLTATTTAAVFATSAAALVLTSSEMESPFNSSHDNSQRKQRLQLHFQTNLIHKDSNNDDNPIKQSPASKQNNFVQCEADKTPTSSTNHPSNEETSSSIDSNITFRQRRLTLNKSSSNEIPKEDQTISSNSQKNQNEQETYISRRKTNVNNNNGSTNTSTMRILYSTEFEQSEESFSPNAATTSSKHENNDDTTLPFPSHQVGTYSCHGVEPHPYIVYTKNEKPIDVNAMSFFDRMFGTNASEKYTSAKVVTVSQRKINQDRGHIIHPYGDNDHTALFGVFDGHGICGEMLAEYTMNAVFEKLNTHPNCKDLDNVQQAFVDIFREIDDEVKDKAHLKSTHSGSTACVVLVHENKVWAANVGDSRVVAARRCDNNKSGDRKSKTAKLKLRAVDWSKDQNANDKTERSRVIKSGGFVTLPYEEGLPARIWLDKDCTQIGLAMSRSIGDHALKKVGVISDPEVKEFKITDQDEFFIIATDGVWEFISSDDAVGIIQGCFDTGMGASDACEVLIKEAMDRWKEKEGDYRDDITAIIVKLKGLWDEHA